jgi:hypothetical protein
MTPPEIVEPSREALEAAHCWEPDDRVPGRPAMTAFRRALRLQQAQWRESEGHPIGTQPIVPRPDRDARPVGSRLRLDHAQATGANFVTDGARAAAVHRLAHKEPRQVLAAQRVWSDLLWAEAFAANLFGGLVGDLDAADRAVHVLWPDVPGAVAAVRLAHSPGRLDPAYLGSLVTWDAAFELDLGDGTRGILAVITPLHDRTKREVAKPERIDRYREVVRRARTFRRGAEDAIDRTDLVVPWLQHLLVHSMLQHPSRRWSWGRFVVVHPAANTDYAQMVASYRGLLTDDATFASITTGALLDAGALPPATVRAVRRRFRIGL